MLAETRDRIPPGVGAVGRAVVALEKREPRKGCQKFSFKVKINGSSPALSATHVIVQVEWMPRLSVYRGFVAPDYGRSLSGIMRSQREGVTFDSEDIERVRLWVQEQLSFNALEPRPRGREGDWSLARRASPT